MAAPDPNEVLVDGPFEGWTWAELWEFYQLGEFIHIDDDGTRTHVTPPHVRQPEPDTPALTNPCDRWATAPVEDLQ